MDDIQRYRFPTRSGEIPLAQTRQIDCGINRCLRRYWLSFYACLVTHIPE